MTEATRAKAQPGEFPLAHHFETPEQQFDTSKFGMWVFLTTEILLFGGLFCWYSVYRANHPEIFEYANKFLDRKLGGLNTMVLICSSLTMAWAVRCAQLGKQKGLIGFLIATLLLAGCFLGIKGIEYHTKWKEGLLWGKMYHHKEEGAATATATTPVRFMKATKAASDRSALPPSPTGPTGLVKRGAKPKSMKIVPKNVFLFFGIYFVMTGLHALHVIAGMIVIIWLLISAWKKKFSPAYFTPVDLGGLYWHLVDIVWIFLFPLLYLIHIQ